MGTATRTMIDMKAATIGEIKSASVIPITVNIELAAEQEITPLFQSYQKAGKDQKQASEQLGRSLLRWRDQYKAQGQAGDGFKALLERLNIPRATAYRLITRADPNSVSLETKADDRLAILNKHAKKLKFDPAFALFIGFLSFEALQSAYEVRRKELPDGQKQTFEWLWSLVCEFEGERPA
jgi:hypothetical protein